MRTYLERYDAGERREVWNELHALGTLAAVSDDVNRDVDAVAVRTMERAASNLAQIHQRLTALGYRFDLPQYAFVPPGAAHAAALDALVNEVGAVPPSLKALLAAVGYVCFRGWLPSWGTADAWHAQLVDPFELMADVQTEIERVNDDELPDEERGFRLPIAGDHLHKNGMSGGQATVVLLPADEADAQVIEDDGVWFRQYMKNAATIGIRSAALEATPDPVDEPMWLVDYLRLYFAGGGFRRVAGTVSYPEALPRGLTDGLLEI